MSSDMTRQEIPSIVVHHGSSSSADISPEMEPTQDPTEPMTSTPRSDIIAPVPENICVEDPKEEGVASRPPPPASSPLSAPELTASPLCYKSPSSSRTASPTEEAIQSSAAQVTDVPVELDMAIGHCAQPLASPVDDGRSRSLDFHQASTESEDLSQDTYSRTRHGPKKTLQRSHAMRDDSSPPPNMLEPCGPYQSHMGSNNSLTVEAPSGNFRRPGMYSCSRQGSSDTSSIPSRCSPESGYTDVSGINMPEFLAMTFNKSRKDRSMLLEIEQELIKLVEEKSHVYHRFQPISSYHRMLVHRCAAYFGLTHASEHTGSGIIVTKEARTRIPPYRFAELASQSNEKKSILQRDYGSLEDPQYKNYRSMEARRTKSLEEREEAYEKAKKRIFCHDMMSNAYGSMDGRRYPDELQWWQPENPRRFPDHNRMRNIRQLKGESFDQQDSLHVKSIRPNVFKSNSFGGYSDQGFPGLSRGNSVASNPQMRFTKQDSMGRYSDYSNSSGYKTQRQDTSSTNISNTLSETPSPTTGNSNMVQHVGFWGNEQDTVMWAVTDMDAVPIGAVLINPQNGQPYANADGTPYRFDPSNPPPTAKPPPNAKYSQQCKDSKKYDSKPELPEDIEGECQRPAKKNSDSLDNADEKSIKSEDDSSHSHSSASRRCLSSAQSVSELRGQLSALRVADHSPECASDLQSAAIGHRQHGRHMYSQPVCYGPQPVKHFYPPHASTVDTTGQTVAMPPVNLGMTLAHPTPATMPSNDGSSYLPAGNFTFVSLVGTPNAPGAAPEPAASQIYCAMPPAQMPIHGPVPTQTSLPIQYSVPSTNASSCNIVGPYWHGVSNPQVYQPAAGLQAYPSQIFGSPAAAQPIPTPPPMHSSQGTVIPAGYGPVPGGAPSQYVMVPQPSAQNFVRPQMQVQTPPPFPLFHCGGMQGPLPPCPNPPFKPFMSAPPHESFVGVKEGGHELKPYPGPAHPVYPPNHAHFGGQSYATSITRPRYMQS